MYSKKRNQPHGPLPASSVPPNKRLFSLQHPEAESSSSSSGDLERSCLIQRNFAAPSHTDNDTTANCKYAAGVLGKRSCANYEQSSDAEGCSKHSQVKYSYAEESLKHSRVEYSDAEECWKHSRIKYSDAEECLKRSRIEYSEATVSGITFQKDMNLHHARMPSAESESARIWRHVGSCSDAVYLNSRGTKLVEIHSNETDVDKHGIRRCDDADKQVTFISSRVQQISARQGVRDPSVSSISCCGPSTRHGSHSNSRNMSFYSYARNSSLTSPTCNQKAEAGARGRFVSPQHVVIRSSQISSAESPDASFLDVNAVHSQGSPADTVQSKGSSPSYVLSSGRLSLEEEARLGRRLPTIDDDFEEYFSSMML